MPLVRQTFYCKRCKSAATLDSLTEGLVVVECACGMNEIWNPKEPLAPLEHFTVQRKRIAEA